MVVGEFEDTCTRMLWLGVVGALREVVQLLGLPRFINVSYIKTTSYWSC